MKTTFSRIFFPTAIILLVALLLVGFTFQYLVENYLEEQVLESLENDCATVAELAAVYFSEDSLSGQGFLLNLSVASRVSGADAILCDSAGQLILCSDAPFGCEHQGWVISSPEYLLQVTSKGCITGEGQIQGLYPDRRYMAVMPIPGTLSDSPVGYVFTSLPQTEVSAVMDRISDIYLIISLLVVLIAVFVMSVYARHSTAPLQDMARVASAFGHGELRARAKVSQEDPQEVQELAIAFNNMAASLEKSEYKRTEFVANVSHELKTPMTTIGGYVDGILDGTIPQEKQRYYMQIVSDETKRLSRLVRSMLDISRLQDREGIPEDRKRVFDVTERAGQVLLTFEQKINSKALDVAVDMPEHPVETFADEDAITQVLYNLVDNAVKFCPQGGQLGLTLRETGEKIYVTVANEGDTIPPEELPLVFDRFHKLDKSRSQNREGWGLGLYIVKTLVTSHGEDISVSSRDGRTEFTFTLPLHN